MIGDAWSDVQAGQRAGVLQNIHVKKTGRGTEQLLGPLSEEIAASLIFDNLHLAFDAIFSIDHRQASKPNVSH